MLLCGIPLLRSPSHKETCHFLCSNDARLLVSQKSEHPLLVKAGRSYYDALLRQGIRIYEYNKGIEHSKYIIIDDDPVNLLPRCGKTTHEMAKTFQTTIAESKEIDLDAFSKRSYREKLIESALRPLSPVL